jgi:hypothetical protein
MKTRCSDNKQQSLVVISLPSLIHRIGGDNAKRAQAIAVEKKCELKRIRRSRNWQIAGEALDVKAFFRSYQGRRARADAFYYQ